MIFSKNLICRLIVILFLSPLFSFSLQADKQDNTNQVKEISTESPHVQALKLVFETQQEEIRKLDSGDW